MMNLHLILFSLIILVISSISVSHAQQLEQEPSFTDYSKYENIGKVPHLDGLIPDPGCEPLGGRFLIGTIDALPVSTVALCELDGNYLKVKDFPDDVVCTAEEGSVTDPKTGKIYRLTACWLPRFCNAPGTAGIYSDGSQYASEASNQLQINAGGKQFEVKITAKGTVSCNNLIFVEEEKKISISSRGQGKAIIEVTIPKELLSGEFKVHLDGNNTEYSVEKTPTESTIAIEFDYKKITYPVKEQTIDIIGTQVIPEFSIFSLTVLSISVIILISVILISRRNNGSLTYT